MVNKKVSNNKIKIDTKIVNKDNNVIPEAIQNASLILEEQLHRIKTIIEESTETQVSENEQSQKVDTKNKKVASGKLIAQKTIRVTFEEDFLEFSVYLDENMEWFTPTRAKVVTFEENDQEVYYKTIKFSKSDFEHTFWLFHLDEELLAQIIFEFSMILAFLKMQCILSEYDTVCRFSEDLHILEDEEIKNPIPENLNSPYPNIDILKSQVDNTNIN
ncbi:hypothetical protein [Maribellus mangrovi]|uniref:hypothetical protein n=1 Tax=Maribellus mangrovi TaxID=3133146 RepID=UPI0030EB50CF